MHHGYVVEVAAEPAMFSCVVAGRLPLPPPQQIDATHAVFLLENAEQINHVVVFMTGEQAFPPGYGATVHLQWPGEGAPHWQLLGWYAFADSLRNTKPSAIFRIRDPKRQKNVPTSATLGISVETDTDIDRQMDLLDTGSSSAPSNALVSTKSDPNAMAAQVSQLAPFVAQNVFSYLMSFAPDSAPQAVPLLQRWLEQFQRKLQSQGLSFLFKNED